MSNAPCSVTPHPPCCLAAQVVLPDTSMAESLTWLARGLLSLLRFYQRFFDGTGAGFRVWLSLHPDVVLEYAGNRPAWCAAGKDGAASGYVAAFIHFIPAVMTAAPLGALSRRTRNPGPCWPSAVLWLWWLLGRC